MFTLSDKTKSNIATSVGRPYEEVCEMNSGSDIGVQVKFSRKRSPLTVGRGNPYLSRLQFLTLKEAEDKMMKMIKDSQREKRATRHNR